MEQILNDFPNELDYVQPDYPVTLDRTLGKASTKFGPLPDEWDRFDLDYLPTTLMNMGFDPPTRRSRIAVIDTGCDFTHSHFRPNQITPRTQFGSASFFQLAGWDVINQQPLLSTSLFELRGDSEGHGTHCSGIIAGRPAWGEGTGSNAGSQIIPIRAFESTRTCLLHIVFAIAVAVDRCADVISMSFSMEDNHPALERILCIASKCAVLVAAAGNDGQTRPPYGDGIPFYPAAYDFVLGVEAMGKDNQVASFSNQGYEMKAPGVCIESALPGERMAPMSGTSMAAPFIAGIAGLLTAWFPERQPYEIHAALASTRTFEEAAMWLANNNYRPVDHVVCPPTPDEDFCISGHLVRLREEYPQLDLHKKPRVVGVEFNKGQTGVTAPGEYSLAITFNQEMNLLVQPTVSFGKRSPFRDYYVSPGFWLPDRKTWRGVVMLDFGVDAGGHHISIRNARSKLFNEVMAPHCEKLMDVGIQSGSAGANLTSTEIEIDSGGPTCPEDLPVATQYDPIVGFRIYLFLSRGRIETVRINSSDEIYPQGPCLYIKRSNTADVEKIIIRYITVTGKEIDADHEITSRATPNNCWP